MSDESYCPECLTEYGDDLGLVVCDACRAEANARELIATLTRERDEARAALALAYPRALQAAASVLLRDMAPEPHTNAFDESFARLYRRQAADILALTPDDIERITKEHEHG